MIRYWLLLLVVIPFTAGATEKIDSVLIVTPQNDAPSGIDSSAFSPRLERRSSLLERTLETRSLRLVRLVDKPSRKIFLGVDAHGTVGMHIRMRGN
ncbi:MAG: hypothetical protein HKN49_10940 [Gammaproteobacteria bacterium]|nr:hypothetical protein [Gammaproteobacteria bacterium]